MHIYSKYFFILSIFGIQRYFMTVRNGTVYIPVFSGSTYRHLSSLLEWVPEFFFTKTLFVPSDVCNDNL